jgi:hypothetical protein
MAIPPYNAGLPPAPSASKTPPPLNSMEREFLKKLISLPLDCLLDKGKGQDECKALGQKIFNYSKLENKTLSCHGMHSLQTIFNAMRFYCNDWAQREILVKWAWDGVGDSYERWTR